MNALYVAWQDSVTREWIPVAKLEQVADGYRLSYTAGARRAKGFSGLGRMNDLAEQYESPVLFAPFSNRIISKSRPEYRAFLEWTGLAAETVDPMRILGITGGIRGTDSIELFPLPVFNDLGGWAVDFFLRGMRHLPEALSACVDSLSPDDQLYLMLDFQNQFDKNAIAVRTGAPASFIGYCPKYYCAHIHSALERSDEVTLRVRRVNPDAPTSMRVLCTLASTAKRRGCHVSEAIPPDLQPY